MADKKNILLHKSSERTPEFLGLHIQEIEEKSNRERFKKDIHRDDNYTFYIQEKGELEIMVDFRNYCIRNMSIAFICPGQVHHYLKYSGIKGYFLFINTELVSDCYRKILEDNQHLKQATLLDPESLCVSAVHLLTKQIRNYKYDIERTVIHSMANSLIGMITAEFLKSEKFYVLQSSRKSEIAFNFRKLVRDNFLKLKKPRDYASLLYISVPYLNEVMKEETGYSVNSWIHQEVLLEAKRLLAFTMLSSKEIAYELGYEDHTYFSRLFKKHVGLSPLEFRKVNLNLSNNNQ